MLFNRWCASQEVGTNFEKMKQLVLLEEFKQCVPVDIKTYLEEQKVTAVDKAATLADDYKLTHSGTRELKAKLPTLKSASVGQTSDGARNIPRLSDKGHANREDRSRKSVPTCFYCKKRSHVMAECWVLDKKEKSKVSKGTGLVAVPDNVTLSDNSLMPQAIYHPFVSQVMSRSLRITLIKSLLEFYGIQEPPSPC